ncbi:MAG: hypothetical protein KDA24_06750 [Deltaproteobacteria bacterium]|nr:hypothetical protein [Deltaproteobacteria bacterium]
MLRSTPRALVVSLAVLSGLIQVGFFLATDRAELLTEWLPDDAFYYLLPSWNAGNGAGFSFDGTTPTYGFQPLWGVLLAALSVLLPTKSALLVGALLVGAALHVATGVLLFRCLERWGQPIPGAIAAACWLLNPDLIRVQASGMESGLVGVLLLALLLRLPTRDEESDTAVLAWVGLLAGLLFLTRVSLLPAALFSGFLAGQRGGRRGLAAFGLAFALVTLPWLVWATVSFGQPLPLSGDRKMVGGLAGLARFIAALPGVPDDTVRALLPAREQLLFGSKWLAWPSWDRLWALGPRATLGWSLGHWLPTKSTLLDGVRALTLVALIVPAVHGWRGRRLTIPPGFWLLAAVALVHGGAHHLLLNGYVHYSYWYRVPELLLAVMAVGMVVAPAFETTIARRWVAGPALLALALGFAGLLAELAPRGFDSTADRFSISVLSVADGMNEELRRGTRVGSWNAGLLGWLADGPVVVNLDGLANSREFLPVAEAEVLYRHGHGAVNPTLKWLDEQGIHYLVDLHPIAGLGVTPFYDLIPVSRYTPELRGPAISHWSRPGRDHAAAMVRLTQP